MMSGSATSSTSQPGVSAAPLPAETTVDEKTMQKIRTKIEELRSALVSDNGPLDLNWLKLCLEDTESWPVQWLGTRLGGELMDFVGDQFLSHGRPDLKPVAIQARRRWKELAFGAA